MYLNLCCHRCRDRSGQHDVVAGAQLHRQRAGACTGPLPMMKRLNLIREVGEHRSPTNKSKKYVRVGGGPGLFRLAGSEEVSRLVRLTQRTQLPPFVTDPFLHMQHYMVWLGSALNHLGVKGDMSIAEEAVADCKKPYVFLHLARKHFLCQMLHQTILSGDDPVHALANMNCASILPDESPIACIIQLCPDSGGYLSKLPGCATVGLLRELLLVDPVMGSMWLCLVHEVVSKAEAIGLSEVQLLNCVQTNMAAIRDAASEFVRKHGISPCPWNLLKPFLVAEEIRLRTHAY